MEGVGTLSGGQKVNKEKGIIKGIKQKDGKMRKRPDLTGCQGVWSGNLVPPGLLGG